VSACSLEFGAGPRKGERIPILADRTVLGRHPSCDIVIPDSSVSRHHAAFIRDGERVFIEDLRSRNGTLVNGRRVAGQRLLSDRDEVSVGEHRMQFRIASRSDTEDAPSTGDADYLDSHAGSSLIVSQMEMPRNGDEDAPGANAADQLRALFGINRAIGASLSLEEVLPRLLEGLFEIYTQADRGFVLLVDPDSGRLLLRGKKIRGTRQEGPPRLSVSVLDTVLETRRAILSNDLQSDSRFDASQSIMSGWLRSVMCVPICRADGSVLGVVQLDATARGRGEFRGRDLEVLAGIAGAAAQAVEQALAHDERLHQAKLNRDLELAGDVQKALLPSKPPEIPGYEVFDFYEPARHVGGDYFNYVPLPDGRIAVVMADVSGKGVPAAMVMAVLSGDVKYCLAAEPDLVRAVTRINDSVCRSGWDERFATFVAAVLDPRTHRATLVNAGHLPAYVRDSEGGVTAIGPEQGGLPLGLAAEWEYRASEISIEPGMTLVFFTDGISEAMDVEDRLYGLERIEAQVGKPGGSPEEVGRRILADVERHTAGQIRSDDMCLVCVGRVLGNDDSGGSSLSLRPAGKTPRRSSRKPSGPGNR
jgi:serine phosphatase RsbU (regulator of sigma subunit)